ncbi:hypothetical protein [Aliivibrio fischeri]
MQEKISSLSEYLSGWTFVWCVLIARLDKHRWWGRGVYRVH